MKRNEQSLVEIMDEIENTMINLLEDIFGVKFELVTDQPETNNKTDFEDWEKGSFKEAEVFKA